MTQKVRNTYKNKCEKIDTSHYQKVALVLQGGGALGSYQAGVYEGLEEAGIHPNWIAGISIGALNTAIIAGNAPENRVKALKEFWKTICTPSLFPFINHSFILGSYFDDFVRQLDDNSRSKLNAFEAFRTMMGGQQGFFVPRFPLPIPGFGSFSPNKVSYYDTNILKSTLEKFADFDRINSGEIQVSLGAVNVRTGNFAYFDNTQEKLLPEHFMASGALPPGFPAVEINGEFYWDGGLISNTPLAQILDNNGEHNTLIFQVDLWSSKGDLPTNFYDVEERTKDIQYSSRTRLITNLMQEKHKNALLIKELLNLIPDKDKQNDWCLKAENIAKEGLINVIHLIYKNKIYDGHYKDYEFSMNTMNEHWESGLNDIRHSTNHQHWFTLPSVEQGFITHDVHRKQQHK